MLIDIHSSLRPHQNVAWSRHHCSVFKGATGVTTRVALEPQVQSLGALSRDLRRLVARSGSCWVARTAECCMRHAIKYTGWHPQASTSHCFISKPHDSTDILLHILPLQQSHKPSKLLRTPCRPQHHVPAAVVLQPSVSLPPRILARLLSTNCC